MGSMFKSKDKKQAKGYYDPPAGTSREEAAKMRRIAGMVTYGGRLPTLLGTKLEGDKIDKALASRLGD